MCDYKTANQKYLHGLKIIVTENGSARAFIIYELKNKKECGYHI